MGPNNAHDLQALFYSSRVRQEECGHLITAQIVSSTVISMMVSTTSSTKLGTCPCRRLVFIVNDGLERDAVYAPGSR